MKIPPETQALLDRRARLLGPNVPTFYDEPVHIVRSDDVWLWDSEGRKYLDGYNNVAHVGHCNARVVAAIAEQAATLNTHTRYLHEGILDYVERLTGTMGDQLTTAIMTCTGSEANDIALRMAEAATGKRGIIATDATYHGNTALVSQLSSAAGGETGFGLSQFFRFVPAPDSLRAPDAGAEQFLASLISQIEALEASGHGFGAFLICPFFLNEGFPDLPDGWLKPIAEAVHGAGGVLICDEVQSGFGRTGTHFWAHEKMGVSPDIVVLGKPMANGHPVGAVATSAEIIADFRKGYRYFNTFGGNPVSAAVGKTVIEVIEDEGSVKVVEAPRGDRPAISAPREIADVPNDISADDFAAAIEQTVFEFKEGDIVAGTVVRVDPDEVLVDIGYKSEGVIPPYELSVRNNSNPADIVAIGDEIEALVLQKEDDQGRLVLSKKRAQYERAWGDIEAKKEADA